VECEEDKEWCCIARRLFLARRPALTTVRMVQKVRPTIARGTTLIITSLPVSSQTRSKENSRILATDGVCQKLHDAGFLSEGPDNQQVSLLFKFKAHPSRSGQVAGTFYGVHANLQACAGAASENKGCFRRATIRAFALYTKHKVAVFHIP
jgi:hypothetical protein